MRSVLLLLCASVAPAQILSEAQCHRMGFEFTRKYLDVANRAIRAGDLTPVARFMGQEWADSLQARIVSAAEAGEVFDCSEFGDTDEQIEEELADYKWFPGDGFFTNNKDVGNEYWFTDSGGFWHICEIRMIDIGKTLYINWDVESDSAGRD